MDERTAEDKPLVQTGVDRRTGNSALQPDNNADTQFRQTAVEEPKQAELPSNVVVRPDAPSNVLVQPDSGHRESLAGQVPEKQKSPNEQSSVNVVAKASQTDSKANDVRVDSVPVSKLPNDQLEGKKPIAQTTAAVAGGGIDDVNNRRDKIEPEKSASVVKSNTSGAAGEDQKVDGVGRHRIPAEEADREVGRAPPGPDDAVVGDDERDNQVKPPKMDQKGARAPADDLNDQSPSANCRILPL